MKLKITAALLITGAITSAFAQGRVNPKLAALRNEKDAQVLARKIDSLQKTDKEADLQLLQEYFIASRDTLKSEEMVKMIGMKFPDGQAAFNKLLDDMYNNNTDGPLNVLKYNELIKRFGSNPAFKGNRSMEFAKTFVAFSFAKSDPDNVKLWIDKITDSIYRTQAYSYGARELATAGHYAQAEQLIRIAMKETASREGVDGPAYLDYVRMISGILLDQKKYDEAFVYAKKAYDEIQKADSKINKAWEKPVNDTYLNALVGSEKYQEAFPLMAESIRNGSASPLIKERFKKAYEVSKGSLDGYESFNSALLSAFNEKVKASVAQKMISEQAFNFRVTDVKGKPVTLESLRGKVVILDFWATWCGPCKASFPKMQLAVNAYKNDPDVVFLFIHTWETGNDTAKTIAEASKYLKENNYTFNLMMDLKAKGAPNNSNAAAAGFGLKGIPSKLIIDKKGLIRFKVLGGTAEGDDAFIADMNAMIELAKS